MLNATEDKNRESTSYIVQLWNGIYPYSYKDELIKLVKLHVPTFFTCFLQVFLQTVSIIMCGHLSKEELGAATLGNSVINVAGFGVGIGISTACDTYFSQTYGSVDKKRMGIYLQRSLIIMYIALVFVYCLTLNIRPILILMKQDPVISDMAANYILCFLPGIFFDYTFLVLARYLQNQNVVYPPLFCSLAGNIFNAVSQYVAIYHLGFHYLASAVCQAASVLVMLISIIGYIVISKIYVETWNGWTKEALCDLTSFAKLAIPGAFFCTFQWFTFEVATIFAGIIDTTELGAQGIIFQIAYMADMLTLALAVAVNIRVGQQLGAGNPEMARHSYRVALLASMLLGILLICIYVALHKIIPTWFTNDEDTQTVVSKVLIILGIFYISDAMYNSTVGVLKCCGKQFICAIVGVVTYVAVVLPIGLPLTFVTSLKIRGFWIGLTIGAAINLIIFWLLVFRLDWKQEAKEAQLRAHGWDNKKEQMLLIDSDKKCNNYGTCEENYVLIKENVEFRKSSKIAWIKRLALITTLVIILGICATTRIYQQHMNSSCLHDENGNCQTANFSIIV